MKNRVFSPFYLAQTFYTDITRLSGPNKLVLQFASLYLEKRFVWPRQIIFCYLSGQDKSYACSSVICLGRTYYVWVKVSGQDKCVLYKPAPANNLSGPEVYLWKNVRADKRDWRTGFWSCITIFKFIFAKRKSTSLRLSFKRLRDSL